jgi:hypothetical protein
MSLTERTDEELGQLVSLGAGDAVLALKWLAGRGSAPLPDPDTGFDR